MGIDDLTARIEALNERHRERELKWERRMEREQNQRDRGVGYLIWVARTHARMSQGQLARRLQTSRSAVSRWENGHNLPNFFTLERIAQETELELVIGLRDPEAADDDFVALGVLEDEGRMTEMRMLRNFESSHIPPTRWREKIGYDSTGFSDYIRTEAPPY
jgi:transcriptional regulator with XRE-family HTH domain